MQTSCLNECKTDVRSFVIPLGTKRMCANFETYTSSGTPYCNL
ncbi:MAG: hypothetical protein ACXWZY_08775 [Gaiellaceae bacterium]